jgi:hypothetical protein
MSATLATRRTGRAVATVIRVYRTGKLLGSILLNEAGRTLHCTPDLKRAARDVIVKVLFQVGRCDEVAGSVPGRDGRLYSWRVVD